MSNSPIPLGDLAGAALEVSKGLVSKLLGPTFEGVGEHFGDKVRAYRLKKQVKLLHQVEIFLEKEGVSPKAVNMKVLLPLLDAASLEDNEDMESRWASLLASAADPKNKDSLVASFVEIMKQLSPTHAFVLDVFYYQINVIHKIPHEQWRESGIVTKYLREMMGLDGVEFELAIDNLLRLRLVQHPSVVLDVVNGNDVRIQVTSAGIACATHLGHAFAAACGKGPKRNLTYSIPRDDISNVYWTQGGTLFKMKNTNSHLNTL